MGASASSLGGVESRFYEQSVDDVMPAVDGDELILPDSGDIDDTMSNESDDVLNVDPCLMDSEDELVIDGSVIYQYDSDIDDEPLSTIDDGDILTINHDKIVEYDSSCRWQARRRSLRRQSICRTPGPTTLTSSSINRWIILPTRGLCATWAACTSMT